MDHQRTIFARRSGEPPARCVHDGETHDSGGDADARDRHEWGTTSVEEQRTMNENSVWADAHLPPLSRKTSDVSLDATADADGRRLPHNAGLPRGSNRSVIRGPLMERLDHLAAISVIQAPPGYGKSTLASMWARHRAAAGDAVAWIVATPELNIPGAFAQAVLDRLAPTEHLPSPSASFRAIDALIEANAIERLVIVVDNAGQVTDDALVAELVDLVDRSPVVHLALASRVKHPLAAVAARRHLDLTSVTADDLALSGAELGFLADAWHSSLGASDLQQILTLCGGWPELCVRILAESAAGALRTTSAESYLREVVLPNLAAGGLLEVSLSLSLAAVVEPWHFTALHRRPTLHPRDLRSTMTPPAARSSDRLRLEGYLTVLPGSNASWAFAMLLRHVLFDVMTHHRRDDAAAVQRIFAETGYEQGGNLSRVLEHARAGKHWGLLSLLWSKHAMTIVARHLRAARFAYSDPPRTSTGTEPVLALAAAVVRIASSGRERASQVERVYTEVGPALQARDHRNAGVDTYLTARTAVMADQRLRGQLTQAARTGEEIAAELERRGRAGERADPSRIAAFYHHWAVTSILGSGLAEGIAHSIRAYETADVPDGELIAALAAGHLAVLHTFVGSPAEAERWLELSRATRVAGHPFERLASYPVAIVDAYLATMRLEPEPARRLLDDPNALSIEMWPFAALAITAYSQLFEEPQVSLARLEHLRFVRQRDLVDDHTATRVLDRCTVDTLMAMGEVNRAERMMLDIAAQYSVDRPGAAAHQTSPADLAWLRVSYAQLFLITGDHARAQRLATAALWAPDVVVRDRTDVLMIKAAASWRLGEREKAIDAFRQSVVLSEQIGSVHAFLIVAEGDLRALAADIEFSLPRAVEEHLAARGGIFPLEASFIALSPRELDVLQRMQDHRTVAEIGRSLHLSVNTVKKHLAAINAKLGVHDRRAALAQAKRLGLLDSVDDDAAGAATRRADASGAASR